MSWRKGPRSRDVVLVPAHVVGGPEGICCALQVSARGRLYYLIVIDVSYGTGPHCRTVNLGNIVVRRSALRLCYPAALQASDDIGDLLIVCCDRS